MTTRSPLFDVRAPRARSGVALALLVGLAGCAADPARVSVDPSTGAAQFVGVFTGEFVHGIPLYRFPSIEVVGSRRDAATGI